MNLTEQNLEHIILNQIIHNPEKRDLFNTVIDEDFFKNPKFKELFKEQRDDPDFKNVNLMIHEIGISSSDTDKILSSDESKYSSDETIEFYKTVYSARLIEDGLKASGTILNHQDKLNLLDEIKEAVESIKSGKLNVITPNHALDLYEEQLKENQQALVDNPEGTIGMSTGSYKLDKHIEGIGHQDYIILAARPSMGKTSAVIKMFLSVLLDENKVAVFFSLETPVQDLIARIISQIDQNLKLKHTLFGRDADLKNDDIKSVVDLLRTKKMYIEDFHMESTKIATRPTPAMFAQKLKAIEKIEGVGSIDLVIVDHIGLMSPNRKDLQEGNQSITSISRDLKLMIRQFKSPFIVLSQLNRSLESRVDKRPKLSDLRDSGALEQDADKILFIYRAYIYLMAELKEKISQKPGDKSLTDALELLLQQEFDAAEFILGKNRNGPLGTVDVFFERKNAAFVDEIDEVEGFDPNEMFGDKEVYVNQG